MTSIDEALSFYEEHREEMLEIARQAAMDLYLAGGRKPITAQDVYAYIRDNQLMTSEQLNCNGRWIAAVFCHRETPWLKVGLDTVSDNERNCNGTLRGTWRLAVDEGTLPDSFPADIFSNEI